MTKKSGTVTQSRKLEHVNIVLNKQTQYKEKTTMLEYVQVIESGEKVSYKDVNLETELIGKRINAPVFVSGMTGGHSDVFDINKNIALAISKLGIPMGVGSQRAMIEDKSVTYTYDVKKFANDIILIGNIGITSLHNYSNGEIQNMLDAIDADMLAVHTNPAQESVQPEGSTDFRGLYERVIELAKGIKQPVVLKEVGNGISKEVAEKFDGKVYAIDVQGAGGTTWVGVETYRSKGEEGLAFWEWGIPTALSILETKSSFKGKVFASGGIRSPEDCINSLALGADICGMAKPVLVSVCKEGSEGLYLMLSNFIDEIKKKMAKLGFRNVNELKNARVLIKEPLSKIIKQRGIIVPSRFVLE